MSRLWFALLVAPFFLNAHPELIVGDRDDTKLKTHGTRMAIRIRY